MTDNIVTENWSDFGYRERKMAIELLNAWNEGKYARPDMHVGEHVRAAFNRQSGWVFLTDDDYNAYILNAESELEIHLSCPNCGCEGFPQLLYTAGNCAECSPFARMYLADDEAERLVENPEFADVDEDE